jgi:hypothetical protein
MPEDDSTYTRMASGTGPGPGRSIPYNRYIYFPVSEILYPNMIRLSGGVVAPSSSFCKILQYKPGVAISYTLSHDLVVKRMMSGQSSVGVSGKGLTRIVEAPRSFHVISGNLQLTAYSLQAACLEQCGHNYKEIMSELSYFCLLEGRKRSSRPIIDPLCQRVQMLFCS